jgi:diamine N-acetyltransferase
MIMESDIRLRAIEPEDLDLLYQLENDRSLWDVGTTNVPYSRYTLHDYIATSSDDISADRQVRVIVEDVRTRKTVGIYDLVRCDPQHQRAETGIVVMRDNRRKGYALTALTLLADYALRVVHLHQLYAVVAADNEAAVNLFRKAGYEVQAELRDWLFDGHQYGNALLMQRFL